MQISLTTGVENLLAVRIEDAKQFEFQEIYDHLTQVTYGTTLHVVNLAEKTCTCRRFNLDKLPCFHAIAAVEAVKRSQNPPSLTPITLSHPYYHTNYLCNAYSKSIMPRDIAMLMPGEVAAKVCLPPVI